LATQIKEERSIATVPIVRDVIDRREDEPGPDESQPVSAINPSTDKISVKMLHVLLVKVSYFPSKAVALELPLPEAQR
jgi:hypothetical protein